MRNLYPAAPLLCAGLILTSCPVYAHVIAGARVFPVTLTFDDPGVSDEASLPAITYQRSGADGGSGPTHEVDLGWEYDKTITPDTALIFNDGYDIQQVNGSKTQTGFENIYVTGKWQAITNADHEFVASLGIIREFGGSGTTHTGADHYGSTAPTAYFGKGMGDLPAGFLQPFAVTGELGFTIADREVKQIAAPAPATASLTNGIAAQFNNGNTNAWAGAFSVQYSIPYLQSQVKDLGLPGILGNMIPLVEFTWSSPASAHGAQGATWTAAPGVIYLAQWGEVGVEALVPLNKATGTTVGAVGLVHLFFDDLFPNDFIGKPIFQ
ncbi:hypothetical protein [Lichenicoccus roseus]|uniref:Transporter n=1 Tax=Lichenicoccus roseus TaxID=2683649 RepID=A0A5R9IZW7_9PROT|nr:hypothetical protein [Lichenicoccus roseus]TLU70985.1 hypothetical protein FE263_19225 [Lichenicoccus roseus]